VTRDNASPWGLSLSGSDQRTLIASDPCERKSLNGAGPELIVLSAHARRRRVVRHDLKTIRRKWNEIDEAPPHVSHDMNDRVVRKLARAGDPHANAPTCDARLAAILDGAAAG